MQGKSVVEKCRVLTFVATSAVMLTCSRGQAQDELRGAAEVIAEVEAALLKADKPKGEKAAKEAGSMKEKIKSLQEKWNVYMDKRDSMSAAESKSQWLTIFDLYTEASLHAKRMDWSVWKHEPGRQYTILGEVPDSEIWGEWLKSLQQRADEVKGEAPERAAYLQFLVKFLQADKEQAWKSWQAFSEGQRGKKISQEDYQARQKIEYLDRLHQGVAKVLKIEGFELEKFETALKKREDAKEEEPSYSGRSVRVPKLAKLTTGDKARALLKRVFAIKFAEYELNFDSDDETFQLAVEVLSAEPKLIKRPHWDFIHSVDSVSLYELYAKKFPETVSKAREEKDYAWQNAVEWLVAAPLLKGDLDAALAVVGENAQGDSTETWVNHEVAKKMQADGKAGVLFDFYKKLLVKIPTADVWSSMIELGAQIHRSAEVSQLAEDMIAKQGASSAIARSSALELLAATALAEDDVEKGLAQLRAKRALAQGEVTELLKIAKSERKRKWRGQFEDWGRRISEVGEQIKKIGEVTQQAQIAREGGEILTQWYQVRIANFAKDEYGFSSVIEALIEQGDLALAEKAILDQVKTAMEKAAAKNNYPGSNPFNQSRLRELGLSLVKLYGKAERYQDVVSLFEKWPFWGVFDLFGLAHTGQDVGFDLAKALEKTGDQQAAAKILEALLLRGEHTGEDEAYAMLLRLQGDQAMVTLDRLYQRDAFEERPLIWKGVLLLQSGKLDQAEVLIRKAISIDPSDGEQGKGDRMKVYGVLADILEAKGEKEDAKLYRGVLKAIRLAEDADDVYAAGLISRGIKQYQQALTHFSDAYCIQSRLAKQLNDAGRIDEARVHYRKAFELMPDSFGRMESHCFGCEGVFNGKDAEEIAEQVFTNLIKENPEKPQLYYLLGYLRDSQDRKQEALQGYQKAVQLDPDYINAWKKISGFADSPLLTLQQRDQATLALSRLDPYGRHGGASVGEVFDVKAMITQLQQVEDNDSEDGQQWFELVATKRLIESLVDSQLIEAGEDFSKNGMSKESLIKQMTQGGQNENTSGGRARIRSFLQQHEVLSSWQQYYQLMLKQGASGDIGYR